MNARFDHLVIAVPDLEAAVGRWTAAGVATALGGRHPGGTRNALVRGPEQSYIELIEAGTDASGDWAESVRGQDGYLSWAVAVDDLAQSRARLVAAGFSPAQIVDGSRETPSGDTIRWRLLQVGEQAFDRQLPFLIQWVEPMPPGPADGPVLEHVRVLSADPERLVRMLDAVGLPRDRSFDDDQAPPWWLFGDPGRTTVAVARADEARADHVSLTVADPTGSESGGVAVRLDGIEVHLRADLRAHRGYPALVETDRIFAHRADPTAPWPPPHPHRAPLDEEYSRVLDPAKYRILTERAAAWIEALTGLGLATAEALEPSASEHRGAPSRITRLVPRAAGGLPLVIAEWDPDADRSSMVSVVPGDGVDAGDDGVRTVPDCGCDACDDGSESLLRALDEEILVVLGGGVLRVTKGSRTATRTVDGWSASGDYAPGEPERWLAGDAPPGAHVIAGEPWL